MDGTQPAGGPRARADGADSFFLIIGPSQMRGLSPECRIVDVEALVASLTEAGLDPAQVDAVREPISLERYVSLTQLEMACLRASGIEPVDYRIVEDRHGVRSPTYGFSSEAPGLTWPEISDIQATCQNRFTGAYAYLYNAEFGPSAEEARIADAARAEDT
jgi:hypothetical protein